MQINIELKGKCKGYFALLIDGSVPVFIKIIGNHGVSGVIVVMLTMWSHWGS